MLAAPRDYALFEFMERHSRRSKRVVVPGGKFTRRFRESTDQGRVQICRRASRDWQFCPGVERPLLMHLLESQAFASEFENTVVINVSGAIGVLFS